MEGSEKPALGVRIFAPLFFIFGTLLALSWFFLRLFDIFLGPLSEIEIFDKGSFYMLGVGLGMLILSFVTVQEGWIGRILSNRQSDFLTKSALVSIASIFVVPHLTHYAANSYFLDRGYTLCEDAGHQWLFVRDIVYVKPSVECSADIKGED